MFKKQLLVLNGSYNYGGTTEKCLHKEAERLCKLHHMKENYIQIPNRLWGCIDHQVCIKGCLIKDDGFPVILKEVEKSSRILLGSPVYLDMPTPKTVALLSRLNCMAENTDRKFFKGKKIHLLATGYCSGTKSVIQSMMGACEMLGFDIEGRSTKEYIKLWKDNKIRGGRNKNDACFLEKD